MNRRASSVEVLTWIPVEGIVGCGETETDANGTASGRNAVSADAGGAALALRHVAQGLSGRVGAWPWPA
jgi:hypothetical protein